MTSDRERAVMGNGVGRANEKADRSHLRPIGPSTTLREESLWDRAGPARGAIVAQLRRNRKTQKLSRRNSHRSSRPPSHSASAASSSAKAHSHGRAEAAMRS